MNAASDLKLLKPGISWTLIQSRWNAASYAFEYHTSPIYMNLKKHKKKIRTKLNLGPKWSQEKYEIAIT